MKPAVNPAMLRTVVTLVGTILVALASAQWGDTIPPLWLDIARIVGGVLVGKELLRRTGDYAPEEVTVVDGRVTPVPSERHDE